MLRHADPPRGALAADHQDGKEQRKADDAVGMKASEKDERHDEQSVGRIPIGAHRALHAKDLDRPGESGEPGAQREGRESQFRHTKPGMRRGARIGADDPQLEAERGARHQQMHQHDGDDRDQDAAVDGGAEQARQSLGDRQDRRLRHVRRRIAERNL